MLKKFFILTKKEFLSYFDSPIAYIFIAIFLIIVNWLFFQNFFLFGQVSMRSYFATLPWVLVFLLPSLSMRLLSEEIKEGTIEVLLTLPITNWAVILAKWLASWLLLTLVLVLSLTIPWTLAGLGDLELGPVFGGYVGSLFLAAVYLSLGIFISSLTKNQIVSFIIALAIGFVWWLMGLPIVTQSISSSIATVVQIFSPASHWDNATRGLIDTRDLVFYVSFTILWIYLAITSLSKITTKKPSNHWLITVLVVAIIIVSNIASALAFKRFDLTEDNIYTLAPVSKKIATSFDDNVLITGYISSNLPISFVNLRQEVKDLLAEYENNSQGKIKINYVDPVKSLEAEREASGYGIPKIQFNTIERDKLESLGGYFGLVFIYGENVETIPMVETKQGLEYEITSTLKKLSQVETNTIAWLEELRGGLGEETSAYSAFKKELAKQYDITNLDVENFNLPQEAKVLVVAGFNQPLSIENKYAIDQFLMSGGSLLYLKERVVVGDNLMANQAEPVLEDLLESYGIKLEDNLVLDRSAGQASFSSGLFQFVTEYPYWPQILKNGFNSNSVITNNLESAVLPWPSSVSSEAKPGLEILPLVKTSSESWVVTDNFNLSPQQNFSEDNLQPSTLAVLATGRLASFFTDKDKPQVKGLADFKGFTDQGRVIVVGDSDFVTDTFLRIYPSNFLLGQNLVDWLAQDEDLIAIRSRGVSDRPIIMLSDSRKSVIRYVNIFGTAGLVIVLGLVRFLWRRRFTA